MAAATVAARASGYVRTAVLAAVVGVGLLGNAFGTANAFPNMLFEVMIGGGLRSVLVPSIVSEFERDRLEGWKTVSAIFNLAMLILAPVTLLAALAAPWIFRALTLGLSGPSAGAVRATGAVLLALMAPQILFYGIDLVATGALNAHRQFALPALAVIAGNIVATGFLVAFGFGAFGDRLNLSTAEYLLLGGGATAGVAAIALIEIAAILRLKPRYSKTLGRGIQAVSRAVRSAGWMVVYVASNQLGFLVVLILANRQPGGVAAYQYAYMFFMLPYGVVGLSLAGAMLPEASSLAAKGQVAGVGRLLSSVLGLAVLILVPASLVLAVVAKPLVGVLLGFGRAKGEGAAFVGAVLQVFVFGLVPFAIFQLLARASFAFHNTRRPALVNAFAIAVNVAMDLILFNVLTGKSRILGLAAGHAISYLVAASALWRLTQKQIPFGIDLKGGLRSLRLTDRKKVD